jgi:hypothetical protein
MEFCKLKNSFDIGKYTVLEEQNFFGEEDKSKGIWYYHVDFPKKQELLNLIPEKYHKDISITLMKINMEIPIHTDTGIKSTLNFYIKTNDCLTQFYKTTENTKFNRIDPHPEAGFLFDEDEVIRTHSFVAQDNEAWILDVSKPHSVKLGGNFKERLAIAMSCALCYNDLKQILTDAGQL